MTNEENPYRFVATAPEISGASSEALSTFRQPESGRKLDAKDIRRLAFAQRGLTICMLILACYALVVGFTNVFGAPQPQDIAHFSMAFAYIVMAALFVAACVILLAFVAGLFFVFAVGRRTHRMIFAILLTLFALSPPLALPIYLYLHLRANYVLKRHGIPVGWLGASWRSLPGKDDLPLPSPAAP